jgi:cyclase
MKRIERTVRIAWVLLLSAGAVVAAADLPGAPERAKAAPEGFIAPPLHPAGARLETKQLAPGVYALVSTKPPVDNSGFVVGERGVLVIDAHINGAMARQIQAAVREVTDKPILYLVNTNFHGDHTFGNDAFPAETRIVAHRKTAERMREFEKEKQFLMPTVNNDPAVYADVKLRLPDQLFDQHLRLDLGGRVVELYHWGPGNTPGDTVVYVPEAKVAWTGNLVLGEGTIPFLIEGGARDYRQTIAQFARTLEVKTIVPGHGPLTTGAILDRYLRYLDDLTDSVGKAARAGRSLEEALASLPLGDAYALPPAEPLSRLVAGVHRWNVQQSYLEVKRR